MSPIVWSPSALRDLESIRSYIAHDSPAYADLVVRRLVVAVQRLQRFPESGRIVPEFGVPELREVIRPPYRLVYRVRSRSVEIVTVFRASRLLVSLPEGG